MSGIEVVDVAREALWVTLKIAGPLLVVSLLVGLVVSFFQAITQIQEMTLTFIPKIIALFGLLFVLLPFFGHTLEVFSGFLFDKIVMIESAQKTSLVTP